MTIAAPIKVISVSDLERALEEFERIELPRGSGKSHLLAYLHAHAHDLEDFAPADERDLIVVLDPGVGSGTLLLLRALLAHAISDEQRFARLVDALMPAEPIPGSPVVEQARRNAAARSRFLAEVATVTSAEVADLSGSRARNKAALANAWRKAGRVFAVPVSGQLRFPLFQFDHAGQPKSIIAELLAALRGHGLSGWEVALWFTGATERLDGKRPLDLLDKEPEQVLAAAQELAAVPW